MNNKKITTIAASISLIVITVFIILYIYIKSRFNYLFNNVLINTSNTNLDEYYFFYYIPIIILLMGVVISVLTFFLIKKTLYLKFVVNKRIEENKNKFELKAIEEKLKEEIKYDRIKTEFFANMSHEFKTPLNIIMGAIQLLDLFRANGTIIDPEEKLEKYLKSMKQNAYRLLRLINNIIDLTKIDISDYKLEIHNYNIIKIIEGVIESININAKVKDINITLQKEVNEKIVACDANKIERILLNILSNALKFTNENGKIDVTVGTTNNMMFISVKDDGIGIHEEKQKIIFERFRQVDKSFTRNREGSGIGLSIVKALVNQHNGKIHVNSVYGEGSEFIIEIPLIVLDEEVSEIFGSNYNDERMERIRIELSDI